MMLVEIDTPNNFFWVARLRARNADSPPGPGSGFLTGKALCSCNAMCPAPRLAHCALLRAAPTFRITRLYEVRDGEPLSVTTRMMWATPDEHGLFAGAQFGRHAAVAVAAARAVAPCEIVTSAMFCPGTKPAST